MPQGITLDSIMFNIKVESSIFVAQVIDGGHFWAQFSDLKNKKRLRDMMAAITERPLSPLIMDASKMMGTYCLARYSGDGFFYRAKILEVKVDGKHAVADVRGFV